MASHRRALSRAASEGGPIESGLLRRRASLTPDRMPLLDSAADKEEELPALKGFGPEPAKREKPYSSEPAAMSPCAGFVDAFLLG